MSIQSRLTELIARDGFYVHILKLLFRGQNDILRFPPCEYFTIPFESDEVLFTDQYRADIEAALGQPLIEEPAPGNKGKVVIMRLSFPLVLLGDVDKVLLQHLLNSASAST